MCKDTGKLLWWQTKHYMALQGYCNLYFSIYSRVKSPDVGNHYRGWSLGFSLGWKVPPLPSFSSLPPPPQAVCFSWAGGKTPPPPDLKAWYPNKSSEQRSPWWKPFAGVPSLSTASKVSYLHIVWEKLASLGPQDKPAVHLGLDFHWGLVGIWTLSLPVFVYSQGSPTEFKIEVSFWNKEQIAAESPGFLPTWATFLFCFRMHSSRISSGSNAQSCQGTPPPAQSIFRFCCLRTGPDHDVAAAPHHAIPCIWCL